MVDNLNSLKGTSESSLSLPISMATPPKKKEPIQKVTGGMLEAVHRFGISLTAILPFSTRSILFNIIAAPIRIPIRLIQSAGPGFSQKMKKYMAQDWNQGVKIFYTDLEANLASKDPKVKKRAQEVIKENSLYMNYAYPNEKPGGFNEKDGVIINTKLDGQIKDNKIPENHKKILNEKILPKFAELGFKCDAQGNYYDTKTGTIFNLVYNQDKKEIVLFFQGMGHHENLKPYGNVKDIKEKVGAECFKAAGADWSGGIPPSSRQAIEIGRILKDATDKTDMTPVVSGHSHGGGLAQIAAASYGHKAVVFNSRPIGASTLRYMRHFFSVTENAEKITIFSGKGDWLSGSKCVNALAAAFERLIGIPVPRSVGNHCYHLPRLSAEDYGQDKEKNGLFNHCCFDKAYELLEKQIA